MMAGERALHGSILASIAAEEVTMRQIIDRMHLHWPDTPGQVMIKALNNLVEAGMVEACVSQYEGESKYRLTGLGRGDV